MAAGRSIGAEHLEEAAGKLGAGVGVFVRTGAPRGGGETLSPVQEFVSSVRVEASCRCKVELQR